VNWNKQKNLNIIFTS